MKRNETLSEKGQETGWRGDKKMFLEMRTRFIE